MTQDMTQPLTQPTMQPATELTGRGLIPRFCA